MVDHSCKCMHCDMFLPFTYKTMHVCFISASCVWTLGYLLVSLSGLVDAREHTLCLTILNTNEFDTSLVSFMF
jgi:hypothetical protein